MKKKSLIFLTKQFPYLNREQYVAHELEFLAKKFDKVYIYPHDHFSKDDVITFQLPPNVEVINLNQQIPSVPSKVDALKSYFSAFFYELKNVHDKFWFLKKAKWFFSIYTTQFALGNGLMDFMKRKNLKQDDVVFYSYWFSASALCLSILKSRRLINKFVSRAHASDLYHEDWGLLNDRVGVLPFRNFKQKYVDVVYSISDHGKKYLQKKYPEIKRVEVAYLGVKDFGLNPQKADDRFVIVTCSGVDENKRIHLLGEALSRLDREVEWIHFGDGRLKDRAIASVTSPNVIFRYKGQTPNADVRKFMAEHHVDLFVNLSIVEGLPVTIMEALSHGIPVLATAANGTTEAVIEGETGKLLKVEFSETELDAALNELMTHSDNLIAMRYKSRMLYERRFDADKNYTAFADALFESK